MFMNDTEPKWTVTYGRNGVTMPITVCAADEETAIMRAGMKRAELNNQWGARGFASFRYGARWERLDVRRDS
jgi:hypothetical protein